jgi:hypothetical protein
MLNAIRNMNGGKTIRVLRVVRLALSGAIVGAAFVGIFFPHAAGLSVDAFGAGAGFATVLLVKAAHLI